MQDRSIQITLSWIVFFFWLLVYGFSFHFAVYSIPLWCFCCWESFMKCEYLSLPIVVFIPNRIAKWSCVLPVSGDTKCCSPCRKLQVIWKCPSIQFRKKAWMLSICQIIKDTASAWFIQYLFWPIQFLFRDPLWCSWGNLIAVNHLSPHTEAF